MEKLFPYAKEALENTHKIAERCNVTIEFGNYKLPHYDVPEGFDAWTYLQHLCAEGIFISQKEDQSGNDTLYFGKGCGYLSVSMLSGAASPCYSPLLQR